MVGESVTQYYTIDTYEPRTSIGFLIRRARSLMMAHLDAAFAPHDLNFIHWIVLMHLRHGIAHTAAEIARELRHDSGALTRVIDQLQQRGLIARARCVEDRRVVTLNVTESGGKLVDSLVPLVVDLLNTAVRGFTAQEVETLTGLLIRLTNDMTLVSNECGEPPRQECSR